MDEAKNKVTLQDLRAYENDTAIIFDCPCRGNHRLRILKSDHLWAITGELPNLTIRPCISAPCWHGKIDGGFVLTHKEGEVLCAVS